MQGEDSAQSDEWAIFRDMGVGVTAEDQRGEEVNGSAGAARGRRAGRVLAVVVGLSTTFGAGALVAAHYVKSPAQAVADAAPPSTGPVTARVERRIMQNTVVMRGIVAPERSVKVRAPGASDGVRPVVTRVAVGNGDTITAGRSVAEVSGRPVLVLPGAVPAYRDLVPGSEGADVAQLQEALRALKYPTGADRPGVYGPGTKSAVAALYKAAGYAALPTGADDDQQILAAERALRDAKRGLAQATSTPKPEGEPSSRAESGPAATNDAGAGDARQRVSDAQQDLNALVARTGAKVPLGEIVFAPSLPARVQGMAMTNGSTAPDVLCTLAGGDLVVRATITAQHARQIRPGHKVDVVSEVLGTQAQGTVASVGPSSSAGGPASGAEGEGGTKPETGGAHGEAGADDSAAEADPVDAGIEVVVRASAALDPALSGHDVRLTVVAAATESEVLVVPLAAVTARADGQPQLIRVGRDGREERIAVTAGISGGGYVEVTPTSGSIAADDAVVIGR